jgi:hypothetical protein
MILQPQSLGLSYGRKVVEEEVLPGISGMDDPALNFVVECVPDPIAGLGSFFL